MLETLNPFYLITAIPIFIYLSYYINLNYLFSIIIILIIYILYLIWNKSLFYDKVFNTIDSKLNPTNHNKNSNTKHYKYLSNNKSILNIYNKLFFLKKINPIAYSNSIKYMNRFTYLINKKNLNNRYQDLILYRNEALNQLKSIDIKNNNYQSDIHYYINQLLEITQSYIFDFEKNKPKNINIYYPVEQIINSPEPNNIYTMDFNQHYSLY